MSAERIVVIGPPASGKGTQVRRLQERFGFEIASTGQMLRDEEARQSPIGLLSIELSKTGTLLPDGIVVELVACWVNECRSKVLFDGFPRTIPQAYAFDELLAKRGIGVDLVIELGVCEAVCRERVASRLTCRDCGRGISAELAGGRSACPSCGGSLGRRRDDASAAFHSRMEQFREKTLPLLGFYADQGKLETVDGTGTPDEVFDLIAELVE